MFDHSNTKIIARPFLKWAGGKTQLINDISNSLPLSIKQESFTYIEPFVGSGAVLFWMINNFKNMKKAVINDVNSDLMDTYKTIAEQPRAIINILEILQKEYHNLENDEEGKKNYFYSKRDIYKSRNTDDCTH